METDEVIKLVDNIYKVSAFWGVLEHLLLFSDFFFNFEKWNLWDLLKKKKPLKLKTKMRHFIAIIIIIISLKSQVFGWYWIIHEILCFQWWKKMQDLFAKDSILNYSLHFLLHFTKSNNINQNSPGALNCFCRIQRRIVANSTKLFRTFLLLYIFLLDKWFMMKNRKDSFIRYIL